MVWLSRNNNFKFASFMTFCTKIYTNSKVKIRILHCYTTFFFFTFVFLFLLELWHVDKTSFSRQYDNLSIFMRDSKGAQKHGTEILIPLAWNCSIVQTWELDLNIYGPSLSYSKL